jgi:hypothetical protein
MKRLIICWAHKRRRSRKQACSALLTDNKMLIYSCVTSACHIIHHKTAAPPGGVGVLLQTARLPLRAYIYMCRCVCARVRQHFMVYYSGPKIIYFVVYRSPLRQSNYGFVLQCPLKFCEQAFCSASTSCRLHTCAFICRQGDARRLRCKIVNSTRQRSVLRTVLAFLGE